MRRRGGTILSVFALLLIAGAASGEALRIGERAPDIVGGPWLNTTPLAPAALRGRVVLVEFWTYG